MNNREALKHGRDGLLSLHKSLVDFERSAYEDANGAVTSGQFLNLLLENEDFLWLRKFSTLIVDIDEMFAQKDGFPEEAVDAHLLKLKDLVLMNGDDEAFIAHYQNVLQNDPDAAGKQGELRELMASLEI